MRAKRKRVPCADAIDFDTVELRARRTIGPSSAQQTDLVPFRGDASEDLVEMDFRAARLRILAILPIHEKNAHLDASHAARERVQHTVYELRALHGSVPLGEVDRLLDHDARRRLTPQFGGTETKDASIDNTEPVETPVRRNLGEVRINLIAAL